MIRSVEDSWWGGILQAGVVLAWNLGKALLGIQGATIKGALSAFMAVLATALHMDDEEQMRDGIYHFLQAGLTGAQLYADIANNESPADYCANHGCAK